MICLTNAVDRDAIYLNPDHIVYFHRGDGEERRGNTIIKVLDSEYMFHVVEKPEQIHLLIETHKELSK